MSDCIRTTCPLSHGYGMARYRGRAVLAHRLAYSEHHKLYLWQIKGKVVRHTCDNPACVNPEHLLLGTHADNMRDKVQRNRQAKGSYNGNTKLTPEQVLDIRKNVVPRCPINGVYVTAKRLGINGSTISHIRNNPEYWKHI